jgi:hypothetical protein
MRDEGDRFVAWRLDDASTTFGANLEDERMEHALLAYAQRSAARMGAEWFAAEFARRDEEERLQRERPVERRESGEPPAEAPSPEVTLIDASVEDIVVGGAPTSLGLEPIPEPTPQPVIRHPHVPRPPQPEPAPKPKRRRRDRKQMEAPTPSFVISAPEWARMSPGARRLYGLET